MNLHESGVLTDSVRYFFTPSSFAEQVLFYPTRIGHYVCDENYHFTSHSEIALQASHYYHYMLMYVTGGSMRLTLEGRSYRAGAGDAVVFDCKRPHDYSTAGNEKLTFYWIVLDGSLFGEYFDRILELHGDRHVFAASDPERLLVLFRRMLAYATDHTHTPESRISETLYAMLCVLFLIKKSPERSGRSLTEEAMNYIDTHFAGPLPVSEVASAVGLSASYLNKLFRQETGFTPHEYVTLKRIGHAKDLLLSTHLTVRQIAWESGYQSEENFIRAFRGATGASPAAFRKNPS